MPVTVHRTRLRRSPLAALLRVWARLLVAAIAVGAIPAAAHARTQAEPLAAENSPLGLARNPAPACALPELLQAPESPLESSFAYTQTAVDNAYATRGGLALGSGRAGKLWGTALWSCTKLQRGAPKLESGCARYAGSLYSIPMTILVSGFSLANRARSFGSTSGIYTEVT